jgi:FkbM family methyltransferase
VADSISQVLNTAVAHHQARRLDEAARIYEQILATTPHCADAHHLLGLVDATRGNHDLAVERIGRAIQLVPATAVYHANLAKLFRESGKLKEAEASYREAVRIDPKTADALLGLGLVLKKQGHLDEATTWFRRAVECDPSQLLAHMQLGSAVRAAGRLDEAVACYRRSLEIDPNHARAHSNLGSALRLQGKLEEAVACCRRAIELQPDYVMGHLNLAIILLAMGDTEAGWPEYEWRLQLPGAAVSSLCQPLWDGSPLDGRTIMLFLEQGVGDVFHFIRYVPLLRERGARVLVECPSGLVPTLQNANLEIDQLVVRGAELPPFDVAAPLLSVPGILRTTVDTIPCDVPYLQAAPTLVEDWRDRVQAVSGYKVGIAWQGNKKHPEDRWRSMPLAQFEPLSRVEGATLISLQKGQGGEQVRSCGFPVIDWTDEMDNTGGPFTDTAAVMKHLDLVVTCDSAVAHLAGALGVPVWTALPTAADWRWFQDRHDSPWYPTMRLFRQQEMGDWRDLFERIAAALAEETGTELTPPSSRKETSEEALSSLRVEVSPGELLDKISILQIKSERIDDPAKLWNIQTELQALTQTRNQFVETSPSLDQLFADLKRVNEALWDVEDELRFSEQRQDFGPEFVELARSVYRHNDRRSVLKREINKLLDSRLLEEKSYGSLTDTTVPPAEPSTGQGRADLQPLLTTGHVRLKKCRYGPMLYLTQDRYIGQSLDTYGEFSQGEMDLLGQVLQPGQIVLDIGANIGTHTVFFAQKVGPAGTVFAFEPQRVLFQILCANVTLGSLTNVHTRQAAVGSQAGTVSVPTLNYAGAGNFGGVSLEGQTQGENVPLLTVDQLGLTACHLIKIDVEGMESDVLAGAEQTMRQHRPIVYVENDREAKSAALIEQLFALDYRLYWHLPPLFNPNNHLGKSKNLFPGIVSANMLGIHCSASQNIPLREIHSPNDRWSNR